MIKGKRIKFAPLDRKHIDLFLKWFNDPEITQYLIMYKPITRDWEEEWFDVLKQKENEVHFSILLLDQVDPEKIIGNCAIHNINSKNRACSCGITIGEKEYQNKGYGTEAMEMLVEYCFNTLNMNRIELTVYEFNIRAYKSYQKVGFVEEGRKRQARYHNGKYHDEIIMAILREDWEKKARE
ncbi:MAG: GNAT family N-acetyltransferase [Candidatus Lokiarchaeota archaeon]|nr:GNAT family N-acetyltransferase [Candidatus Lokiarchaeota archaeon]